MWSRSNFCSGLARLHDCTKLCARRQREAVGAGAAGDLVWGVADAAFVGAGAGVVVAFGAGVSAVGAGVAGSLGVVDEVVVAMGAEFRSQESMGDGNFNLDYVLKNEFGVMILKIL